MASWLFGFLASWLFGFSASWFFGFLLVYAAFGGFLAFRILCIPSGVLVFAAFCWFMRLLAALAFRILCFPSSSLGVLAFAPCHCFFLDLASRIIEHHGGAPLLLFRLFAEQLHPYLNQHFFKHHGGAATLIAPPFEPSLFRASNFARQCCKIRHFR